MYLSREPGDRRLAHRDRIRQELDRLVTGWQGDVPPRQVLAVLADACRRLYLKIEGEDPIQPARRPRRA
jgi:hypothetical protein